MAEDTTETALREVAAKIDSSLQRVIESHINSKEFKPEQGLDFLDCKNSVLLSYLIDLTYWLRCQLAGETVPDDCLHRLIEMRTILDKVRVLDKKLRYQIDKLLTYQQANLATAGDDPLLYRPRIDDEADESSSDDGGDANEEEEASSAEDDDLATAKLTLALAKDKKLHHHEDGNDDNDDGLYHAPRHSAAPYLLEESSKAERRQKRRLQQLRASEVAETIRHQYSETPELEDNRGSLGRQRASSRRLEERQAERTAFEEDNLMRLQVTRQEKKDRKRMLREEESNLHAIADLGNLVNEASLASRKRDEGPDRRPVAAKSKRKGGGPKNSLAAALEGKSSKRKKKKR